VGDSPAYPRIRARQRRQCLRLVRTSGLQHDSSRCSPIAAAQRRRLTRSIAPLQPIMARGIGPICGLPTQFEQALKRAACQTPTCRKTDISTQVTWRLRCRSPLRMHLHMHIRPRPMIETAAGRVRCFLPGQRILTARRLTQAGRRPRKTRAPQALSVRRRLVAQEQIKPCSYPTSTDRRQ
jgi:hypothetical protein